MLAADCPWAARFCNKNFPCGELKIAFLSPGQRITFRENYSFESFRLLQWSKADIEISLGRS
jgi:hypothetical protein